MCTRSMHVNVHAAETHLARIALASSNDIQSLATQKNVGIHSTSSIPAY